MPMPDPRAVAFGRHPDATRLCGCQEYGETVIRCDDCCRFIPGDPAYIYALRRAQGYSPGEAGDEALAVAKRLAEEIRAELQDGEARQYRGEVAA